MPGGITHEEVLGIAALANLDLSPTEVDVFTRQLAGILAYVDQLRQVDTTGIPPTAYTAAEQQPADRPDQVAPCLDVDDALAAAPDPSGGFFRVPRVIG